MAKAKLRYRKVSVRMWGDEKFRRLSAPPPNGRTLWLYLLTGPESGILPGVIVAGEAGLAEALGWSLKGFREAFAEVSREGLAEADWSARLVWVPKAPVHNQPQSPNVIKAWGEAWDLVPECALKSRVLEALEGFTQGLGEGFAKAFQEAFRKALPQVLPKPGAVAVAGAGAVTGSSSEERPSRKASADPSPSELEPEQQPDPPPEPPKHPPLPAADVERLNTAADVIHASALRVPGLLPPDNPLEWTQRRAGEAWKLYGICDRLKVTPELVLGVVHWLVADPFWQPKVPDAQALERQWKSIVGAMNSRPSSGSASAGARRGVTYEGTAAEFEETMKTYGKGAHV